MRFVWSVAEIIQFSSSTTGTLSPPHGKCIAKKRSPSS
jgi:hypothetical protein